MEKNPFAILRSLFSMLVFSLASLRPRRLCGRIFPCRDDGPDATISPMTRLLLICAATILLTVSLATAAAIPPDADGAEKALSASSRHGEYVDIALPGSD